MKKHVLLFIFSLTLMAYKTKAQHRIGVALRAGPGYYVGDLKRNLLPEGNYIKPVGGISAHYRFRYFLDASYRFSMGQLAGGDQLGGVNLSRNLDFETLYLTNELRLNYYPITVFADGLHKKRPSTASCSFDKSSPREVFKPSIGIGLGHFYFNPYSTQGPDEKTYLKPLGTEGQTIPNYKKPYSLHQLAMFFDIGFVVNPLRYLEVELNVEYVQPFTDYLDDVGGVYPDMAQLTANAGTQAVTYSYRGNGTFPAEGSPRATSSALDGTFRAFVSVRYLFAFNKHLGKKDPNVLNRKPGKRKKIYQPREKAPEKP